MARKSIKIGPTIRLNEELTRKALSDMGIGKQEIDREIAEELQRRATREANTQHRKVRGIVHNMVI